MLPCRYGIPRTFIMPRNSNTAWTMSLYWTASTTSTVRRLIIHKTHPSLVRCSYQPTPQNSVLSYKARQKERSVRPCIPPVLQSCHVFLYIFVFYNHEEIYSFYSLWKEKVAIASWRQKKRILISSAIQRINKHIRWPARINAYGFFIQIPTEPSFRDRKSVV